MYLVIEKVSSASNSMVKRCYFDSGVILTVELISLAYCGVSW